MKLLSLHRTVCGVLSVSLGSLALMLGSAHIVTADEIAADPDAPVAKGSFNSLPDMRSVKDVSRFVKMRQEREEAIRLASAIVRRKSFPVEEEMIEQLCGGRELGIYEAWLERLRVRAYPSDRVNSAAYLAAMKKQAALPVAQIVTTTVSSGGGARAASAATPFAVIAPVLTTTRGPVWEFIGPRNMAASSGGSGGGPAGSNISGRVNEVVYDPSNPNTVYLCAAQGGIWKSVNGGRDWYAIGNTFPMMTTSTVAIHPKNSQIVLAGLGDHQGGSNFGDVPGIMRSIDGGRSWEVVGQIMAGPSATSSILFDPDTPDTVIASTGGGSYRFGAVGGIFFSTNAGKTWAKSTFTPALPVLNGVDFRDMKVGIKKADGTRYYYATNGAFVNDIYRSEDKGKTWKAFPLPSGGRGTPNGIEVAPSAVDANVVYVTDGENKKINKGVVNASGGIDWTDITGDLRDTWSQAFYDFYARAIPQVVDGKVSDVLYVGLVTANGSLGGANQWKDITAVYTGKDTVHADQHAIAFNPLNANEMIIANDGGVYGMTYASDTKTWSFRGDLNKTLGITMFYTADWHPTNPQFALGAAQDNSNPATFGNNQVWRNVGFGDGMTCAINPTNPNIMYVCAQNNAIFRTTDGFTSNIGNSITPDFGSDIKPFVTISAIDPTTPHPYYVGTEYLWRWNENTQKWDARLGGVALADGTRGFAVQYIAVAPSDPNRIYVGTNDARLWVSTNKGTSWKKISDGKLAGAPLPNRVVSAISVNPTNPNDIIVTLSGTGSTHVFRSVNANAATPTFTALAGSGVGGFPDVPANCVARDPDRPTTDFFVGTDIGVFYTSNGGMTWQNATAPLGLPNIEVTAIKAVPKTGYLNVSTYGRGMWRLSLKKVAETKSIIRTR